MKKIRFVEFLLKQGYREVKKCVHTVSSRTSLFTAQSLKPMVTYGIVVFSMMISLITPILVSANDAMVVDVSSTSELSRAIDNARDNPNLVIINVHESITMTSVKWMIGSNIKLVGAKANIVINSSARANIFSLDKTHLELENITIQHDGAGTSYANISLTKASSLTMQKDSLLKGNDKYLVLLGDVSNNQVVMNQGAKIDASNESNAISYLRGGSGTITMNDGSIIDGGGTGKGISLEGSSSVQMNGGTIQNCDQGINVYGDNSHVVLNRGIIRGSDNQYANGVGVSISGLNESSAYDKKSTLVMRDGMIIEDNRYGGVYITAGVEFTMEGGSIRNNTTDDNGGGVSIADNGEFYMLGGTIENNTASKQGGGISLLDGNSSTSGAKAVIRGGVIQNNKAKTGGGIYVGTQSTEGLYFENGEIKANVATDGGGIYMKYNGKMKMTGGTITGNVASNQGGGIYACGDTLLSGGTIASNQALIAGGVLHANGDLHLGGALQIQGNTITNSETKSNLHVGVPGGRYMYTFSIDQALTGEIGFTTEKKELGNEIAEGYDGYQITDSDAFAFVSDENFGNKVENNKIVLAEAAQSPNLTQDVKTSLEMFEQNHATSLKVEAEPSDVTYQWYVNDKASKEGATVLNGETRAELKLKNDKLGTYFYYVEVTKKANHTKKTIDSSFGQIVVYAKVDHTGSIQGSIESEDENEELTGIQVVIMHGNSQIGTTTTVNGAFTFSNLPYGTYNLVATKGAQTITKKVVVNSEFMKLTAKLPKGIQNTVVEIVGEVTPPVVASGFNDIFDKTSNDKNKGITQAEKEILNDGGKIELKLLAEQKNPLVIPKETEQFKQFAKGKKHTIGTILDLSILKTVTSKDGISEAIHLNELPQSMEITIELSEALQAQKTLYIYRIHDNQAPELLSNDSTKEEYYVRDGKYLKIYVKSFSLYAIGFDEKADANPNGNNQGSTQTDGKDTVNTGDATISGGWQFMMLGSTGVLGVAQYKLRQLYVNQHRQNSFKGFHNKLKFMNFLMHQAFHDALEYVKTK